MEFNPSKELSNNAATALVRDIVENGTLIISRHAKERMFERGYTTQDVEFILTHGKIQSSEFDKLTGNWKYRFHGDDLDGGTGTVIVAIVRQMSSIVITVLG
jgi:hypothetical protein